MNKTVATKHYPPGTLCMFFLQLLTMIGFTTVQSVMVLYVLQTFHMNEVSAYSLFGAYMSLFYGISTIGGYIAGLAGYQRSLIVSLIFNAVGLFCLAIPGKMAFYLGLSIFITSSGVSVPSLFVLLGRLYTDHDHRRESGFTMAYIGMNVGAFIAIFASGYLQRYFSYNLAFDIGGVGMLIALLLFYWKKDIYQVNQPIEAATRKSSRKTWLAITLAILVVPLIAWLLTHSDVSNALLLIIGVLACGLIAYCALQEQGVSRSKLIVFGVLNVVAVIFWALYSLAPSALNIFVDRNVDRHLFGWLIPTVTVQSLNPLFIVTLGPLLSLGWLKLSQRNIHVSIPAKFAIGILLMGLGYLILLPGIHFSNAIGIVGFAWIVLSYFLQTLGELFVGPVGFAMVGTLVPAALEGIMVGIWQLSTGVAGALSDYLAEMTIDHSGSIVPHVTDVVYAKAFGEFGLMSIAVGIVAALLVPKLKAIMTGPQLN